MVRLLGFLLFFLAAPGLRAQDTLLLFHPTAYNLALFHDLIREGTFPLDDYHILGVYHEKEAYDYSRSALYLFETKCTDMSLREVTGELTPDNCFAGNPCSETFRGLFLSSRGALFMGGPDIPPALYGEESHLLTSVTDPHRHFLEASYIFHLLGGSQDRTRRPWLNDRPDYLMSGICLGMQTLHVGTGGRMVQDIPSEVYGIWTAEALLRLPADEMHRNYNDQLLYDCEGPTSYHFHRIDPAEGSFLQPLTAQASGEAPWVLSSHHQAAEEAGEDWKVAARSRDGKIIEALEHRTFPHVFGVQFHPEKPGLFDAAVEQPAGCGETVNFNQVIAGNASLDFHLGYWKLLADILNASRE
ncbi:MAG: gamma-glutamyl-gamma-aminobutyrate hydrolase family protein [Bacteroidales bacterium]